MAVARLRQAQQRLQQPVHRSSRWKRSSPRTTSLIPLQRIVDDDGEVIAGRDLLARDDDVAPAGRIEATASSRRSGHGPSKVSADVGERCVHLQPPCIGHAGGNSPTPPGRQIPIEARIERRAIGIARPSGSAVAARIFGPAQEARIDQIHRPEAIQRRGIGIEMFGLPPSPAVPTKLGAARSSRSTPRTRPAARHVDIFPSGQQRLPASRAIAVEQASSVSRDAGRWPVRGEAKMRVMVEMGATSRMANRRRLASMRQIRSPAQPNFHARWFMLDLASRSCQKLVVLLHGVGATGMT